MSDHSRFLALPPELRTRIYEFVGEPRIYASKLRPRHNHQHGIPSKNSLMLVSHQIHDEYYSHLLLHPFRMADAIVVPIKNFVFRPIYKFLDSCTEEERTQLRSSNPPKVTAETRFCKHYRDSTAHLVNKGWEDIGIGRWLRHRKNQADADRIPIRYELTTVETVNRELISSTLINVFAQGIYYNSPHPDVIDLVAVFKPYFEQLSYEDLFNGPQADLWETSASSESEGETAWRAELRRRDSTSRVSHPAPPPFRSRLGSPAEAAKRRNRGSGAGGNGS